MTSYTQPNLTLTKNITKAISIKSLQKPLKLGTLIVLKVTHLQIQLVIIKDYGVPSRESTLLNRVGRKYLESKFPRGQQRLGCSSI